MSEATNLLQVTDRAKLKSLLHTISVQAAILEQGVYMLDLKSIGRAISAIEGDAFEAWQEYMRVRDVEDDRALGVTE